MTTPTRAEMREALARAMGWTGLRWMKSQIFEKREDLWGLRPGEDGQVMRKAPNPFTNAADKDKLVKWLAADDARWYKFKKEILSDWIESPEQEVVRFVFTAPLETISLAAWRAIQEQPK